MPVNVWKEEHCNASCNITAMHDTDYRTFNNESLFRRPEPVETSSIACLISPSLCQPFKTTVTSISDNILGRSSRNTSVVIDPYPSLPPHFPQPFRVAVKGRGCDPPLRYTNSRIGTRPLPQHRQAGRVRSALVRGCCRPLSPGHLPLLVTTIIKVTRFQSAD